LLDAQIAQLKRSQPHVAPALASLEQVAGDEGLGTFTRILDPRPVAQKPLRFFAQRLGDVGEPWPNMDADVQGDQQVKPVLHRVRSDLQIIG